MKLLIMQFSLTSCHFIGFAVHAYNKCSIRAIARFTIYMLVFSFLFVTVKKVNLEINTEKLGICSYIVTRRQVRIITHGQVIRSLKM
jgi:hypothetical protein